MADQGSEGLFSPYLRQRRIAAARRYLQGLILDVGCGSGALANIVPADTYLGVEFDEESIARARATHPKHHFETEWPPMGETFDTVVSLAVIEHVPEPEAFLAALARRLSSSRDACIVLTTPHPSMDWVHTAGASIGLFSRYANTEHKDLLAYSRLVSLAQTCSLRLTTYRRFLFRTNQLVIFQRGRH